MAALLCEPPPDTRNSWIGSALRRSMRRVILRLDPAERCRLSLEVLRRLLDLEEYRRARLILAYASLADEVSTGEIMSAALESGRRIALPVAENGKFIFAAGLVAEPARDLATGPFGVPVPRAGRPRARLAEIDLVLVPGRAFDRSGGRVGRGGGYYDRLLARPELSSAAAFGLAFACQVQERPVPRGAHDLLLPGLITEAELIRR